MIPIARAELALRERGDTAPLREALRRVPEEFDPGGAVTTIAVRLALMERDYDEAERPPRELHGMQIQRRGFVRIRGRA